MMKFEIKILVYKNIFNCLIVLLWYIRNLTNTFQSYRQATSLLKDYFYSW